MTTAHPNPAVELLHKATGFWLSQAIFVAAQLGIADLLENGPRSADDLAEATGAHPPALYRVLRALAGEGIFVERSGSFALTPQAEFLRSDVPGSLQAFILMLGQEWHWEPWGHLLDSVRTGTPASETVFGMTLFDFLAGRPDASAIFDEAMTSRSGDENDAVVAAYDFSNIDRIVDIGCGQGSFLSSILAANPALQGTFFDRPHVIDQVGSRVEAAGLSDRATLVAGDFFESVPQGSDAYIMKKVIHDWDDERAIRILRRCHEATIEGGRVLLAECVIPPGNDPSFSKLLDLLMMVWPGGLERTEAEHRTLLEAAGFAWVGVTPTRTPLISIVEGVRV